MPLAHVADPVILQKRQKQLHLSAKCIFLFRIDSAVFNYLIDFICPAEEFFIQPEKEKGQRDGNHSSGITHFNFTGSLQQIQDYMPAAFIHNIRNLVARCGCGKNLLQFSCGMIKLQGL